jgi:hypothetical protein
MNKEREGTRSTGEAGHLVVFNPSERIVHRGFHFPSGCMSEYDFLISTCPNPLTHRSGLDFERSPNVGLSAVERNQTLGCCRYKMEDIYQQQEPNSLFTTTTPHPQTHKSFS